MKVVIVQLSDIHLSTIKYPDNPILEREDKIVAAVRALFEEDVQGCIMLLNGDIAYQGIEDEYKLAIPFIQSLQKKIAEVFGTTCELVCLPGNHDCDFKLDSDARRKLIAEPELTGFRDGSVADICTKVQNPFFAFCQTISPSAKPPTGTDRLFAEHNFSFSGRDTVVRVLNSAWDSTVHERAGTLLMPVDVLQDVLTPNGKAALVVTAIHHPYGWFEPNNAREFRHLIETTSDLVMTGHEHNAETYAKTKYTGEHNEYIEAGPLQENGQPENSEFSVVVVDLDANAYTVNHFAWKDSLYEQVIEPVARPFIRNNTRLQSEYEISETFKAELNDTEFSGEHPFKVQVTLDDIFVYPDWREHVPMGPLKSGKGPSRGPVNTKGDRFKQAPQSSKKEEASWTRRTIRGREIIDYINSKRKVVLSSPDRSGKTAMARMLFKDLRRNGKIPILIECEKFDSKVMGNLDFWFNGMLSSQYGKAKTAHYWQLDRAERAVIVDDFHKLPNVKAIRDKLLAELIKRFDTIIIVGGPALRFQEIAASDADAALLTDFVQCEIHSFGLRLRSQLIKRWLGLNKSIDLDDDLFARQLTIVEDIIGIALGRDLLPPFPHYILLLLQQVNLNQPVDTSAASYGKLYSAFMVKCLAKRKIDVETGISYLSELAYAFFIRKTDHFDNASALKWHSDYLAKYKDPIDFTAMINALVSAGILVHRNNVIKFRVRAGYYYFVASYMAENIADPAIMDAAKVLAGKMYREDAANIVLFLAHKNPVILQEILSNANKLFGEVAETDLYKDVMFTGKLVARLDVPTLDDDSPEKRRQKMLQQRDAVSEKDDDPSDDMYAYKHEEETEQDSEQRRHIAQINAAFKTIQVLGQIGRAFAGKLTGEQKEEVAEACFSLSLRFLKFVFDLFSFTTEEFGKAIQSRVKRNISGISDEKALEAANQMIFMLVDFCTSGVITHVAASIGVERLSITFDEIKARRSSIAMDTLDVAIRAMHFSEVPEDVLISMYNRYDGILLMQSVIRHLALNRINYHKCSRATEARLCEKLGIKRTAAMLNNDRKL